MKRIIVLCLLPAFVDWGMDRAFQNCYTDAMKKNVCYCEYCGHRFLDVRSLTSGTCVRHPDGANRGCHKLYEGSEKQEYTCKYCGKRFSTILVMVGGQCVNYPKGSNRGSYAPAL